MTCLWLAIIRAQYEQAAIAARRAILSNPSFRVTHSLLAAALPNSDEWRNATDRKVLALQPSFSSSGYCSAVGITSELAETLMEAWRQAVLPP
jgi:adenylate cyclase